MTKIEMLLTILGEECNETAQRVSKALRFTPGEVQPGQELTNAQRIVYEFNDILAVMEILREHGVFDKVVDPVALLLKKNKIEKYLNYSAKVGTLETEEE